MSSNIHIKKICKECKKEFPAKTTVTLYCSPKCRKRTYRKIRNGEKSPEGIRIKSVCQQCNKDFIAKTNFTKFCSDDCAKRAYKLRKRDEKIEKSNLETATLIMQPVMEVQQKEYLSIKEVSLLIGLSRWTIAEMIKKGKMKCVNFGRRVVIRKKDLEGVFG